jgi:hypothetical protein
MKQRRNKKNASAVGEVNMPSQPVRSPEHRSKRRGTAATPLLADLLHLIAGGIVGSMPLSRTQQQTADLFQAAGSQESFRAHTPARLTSAQQSGAVVSGAEKLSSRHVLPRDLSNALKQLDDGELDRLFAATRMSCNDAAGCPQVRQSFDRQPIWAQSSAPRINQQQRKYRPNGGRQKNQMSR